MSNTCKKCGSALARCDWCGSTEPLVTDDTTHQVVPGSDPLGNYHEPCRQAELETRKRASAVFREPVEPAGA